MLYFVFVEKKQTKTPNFVTSDRVDGGLGGGIFLHRVLSNQEKETLVNVRHRIWHHKKTVYGKCDLCGNEHREGVFCTL